jgi:hypothetical protein
MGKNLVWGQGSGMSAIAAERQFCRPAVLLQDRPMVSALIPPRCQRRRSLAAGCSPDGSRTRSADYLPVERDVGSPENYSASGGHRAGIHRPRQRVRCRSPLVYRFLGCGDRYASRTTSRYLSSCQGVALALGRVRSSTDSDARHRAKSV